MKPYILVVEDEAPISTMIQYNLEKEDFEVEIVEDGEDALYSIEERKPDLILMDWMIPSITGVEICARIRKNDDTRNVPVIMVTARGEEDDRLVGLEAGADDYIVKPFSPKELVARIRAVLRRTRPVFDEKTLEHNGVVIDLNSHRVTYNGQILHLGPTEFRLLAFLMEKKGKVYSRDRLLDEVWGMDVYVENRTVDVHIRRLRKTLGETKSGLDDMIKTVRSAGYMIE